MLNKLWYIELYISKTRIYRSFSEVPLPFRSMLITFHISNSSKSLESSQFRDQHTKINWHFSVSWQTYTIHISNTSNTMKAINISQFRSRASAPLFLLWQFLHNWREQLFCILFTTSSISRKQTSYKDRNVIEENNDWIIFHSISIYEMLAMKSPVIVLTTLQ